MLYYIIYIVYKTAIQLETFTEGILGFVPGCVVRGGAL
jgi:hypothetical protein